MRTYSIIIPTLNEEKDIAVVLQNILNISYNNLEIIVVDGNSRDKTREIVEDFAKKYSRIRLIKNPKTEGVSVDRNTGIKEATGDVVILLNADVILPENFIKRIDAHYEKGYDFVLVESKVKNQNSPFPRWVQAEHEYLGETVYKNGRNVVWTEGFSCRRTAAIEAGLFPVLGRGSAGEDATFGFNLLNKGFKKIMDKSITVSHYVPEDSRGIKIHRKIRGRGIIQSWYYLERKTRREIILRLLFHSFYSIFYCVTMIIPLIKAIKLSKYSKPGYRDIIPFLYYNCYDSFMRLYGKWEAFKDLN